MVHVDMDAFYAAVEMRDRPHLRDQPMAVGSASMLSTSNYHARKFGVRAAMPGFIGRKLCPALVIVPTNFDKYRAVSGEIREIFADYDPHFQPVSLDEAYLDLTEHVEQRARWPEALRTHRYRQGEVQSQELSQETTEQRSLQRQESAELSQESAELSQESAELSQESAELSPLLFDDDSPTGSSSDGSGPGFQVFCDDSTSGSSGPGHATGFRVFGTCAEEAVREMRFRIEQKTSLTASAGMASNTLLAKVCSDLNKPDGQYRLSADRASVLEFMERLPVRKVPGVGKVSEKLLGALGISSCAHLGQQMALLSLLFSQSAWHHFLSISLGLGATHLERDGERKSMSTERTFRELSRAEDQVSLCRELCEDLSNDLKREGLKGKTVTLKLKNVQFEVRTRAWTLPCAVGTAPEIFSVANQLLRTEMDGVKPLPLRLRLMGVRLSSFVSSEDRAPQQRSIVAFLQNGRTDPPPPPPHISSQPPGGPVDQQQHQSRSGSEAGQNSGTGQTEQRSFFQRAYAQRLRLQAEGHDGDMEGTDRQRDVQETDRHRDRDMEGWGDRDLKGTDRQRDVKETDRQRDTQGTDRQRDRQRDRDTQGTDRQRDVEETDGSTSSERAAAEPPWPPSGCRDTPRPAGGGLPCPVCLGEVDTSDLDVFNAHIDLCLSAGDRTGSSPGRSEHASASPLSQTYRGGFNRQGAGGDSGTTTTVMMSSSEAESQQPDPAPLLACPVCHVTQGVTGSSRDLSAFNRHLDLCLNRDVVRSLTSSSSDLCLKNQVKGQRSLTSADPARRGPKVKERVEAQPGTSNKHKGKRRHSPRSSPAKKNPSHHLNTIDRFFR